MLHVDGQVKCEHGRKEKERGRKILRGQITVRDTYACKTTVRQIHTWYKLLLYLRSPIRFIARGSVLLAGKKAGLTLKE